VRKIREGREGALIALASLLATGVLVVSALWFTAGVANGNPFTTLAPNKVVSTPAGPYPAGSLHPPLTVAQRVAIRAFLRSHGYTEDDINQYVAHFDTGVNSVGLPTPTSIDNGLIDAYNIVVRGGGFGKGSTQTQTQIPGVSSALGGLDAIGDFFVKLGQANTWIRVGEVLAGVILVTVGAHAVLRSNSGTYRSTYHTAKKLIK